MAALWTEIWLAMPAIQAFGDGYEVYIVTDASGGVSVEAHEMAIHRMIQSHYPLGDEAQRFMRRDYNPSLCLRRDERIFDKQEAQLPHEEGERFIVVANDE